MTQPTRPDEVTIDPEYRRAYDHYVSTGATTEMAAQYAYAWTKRQQMQPPPAPKKTNHVAHGLGLAFTVLIGGPIAFCTGAGATVGVPEEGIPPHPEAFWAVMATWLIVVGLQGFAWAWSARQRPAGQR